MSALALFIMGVSLACKVAQLLLSVCWGKLQKCSWHCNKLYHSVCWAVIIKGDILLWKEFCMGIAPLKNRLRMCSISLPFLLNYVNTKLLHISFPQETPALFLPMFLLPFSSVDILLVVSTTFSWILHSTLCSFSLRKLKNVFLFKLYASCFMAAQLFTSRLQRVCF